jgi:hypothetical protein
VEAISSMLIRRIGYNGSLLKNTVQDKKTYQVPSHWMVDAKWEKDGSKNEPSCMHGGNAISLSQEETGIIEGWVEVAKTADTVFSLL